MILQIQNSLTYKTFCQYELLENFFCILYGISLSLFFFFFTSIHLFRFGSGPQNTPACSNASTFQLSEDISQVFLDPLFPAKDVSFLGCTSWDVCVCAQPLRLFATPWTVARQAPQSIGFSRQEYWSRFPLPTSGDLPYPGIKLVSLVSPALGGGFFTAAPPGKPQFVR